MPRRHFIDQLTGELRVGRAVWRSIQPLLTRYELPKSGDALFDWNEVCDLVQRLARPVRPGKQVHARE